MAKHGINNFFIPKKNKLITLMFIINFLRMHYDSNYMV